MRQIRTLIVMIILLSLCSLAVAGPAGELEAKRPTASKDVVTATIIPAKLTAAAGGEVTFTVKLDIADTWHLYDHAYAEDPESFFIGVDFMPGEDANLAGFQAKFPKGDEGEFMGEKVVMLHHHADIEVTVKLPADAAGTVELPFVLTAQACDDKICLQPSDVPVPVTVVVE